MIYIADRYTFGREIDIETIETSFNSEKERNRMLDVLIKVLDFD